MRTARPGHESQEACRVRQPLHSLSRTGNRGRVTILKHWDKLKADVLGALQERPLWPRSRGGNTDTEVAVASQVELHEPSQRQPLVQHHDPGRARKWLRAATRR